MHLPFETIVNVGLAKTTETFKLSDLQYLEVRLQCRDFECERLVLDAATGSSLLRLSGKLLQDNARSASDESEAMRLDCFYSCGRNVGRGTCQSHSP